MLSQIQLQCPSKQLEEHLKADLANGRVIAALAKLITDKRICGVERASANDALYPREATLTLRPRDFVETEQNTFVMQGLADQITAFGRDMGIVLAEDLHDDVN